MGPPAPKSAHKQGIRRTAPIRLPGRVFAHISLVTGLPRLTRYGLLACIAALACALAATEAGAAFSDSPRAGGPAVPSTADALPLTGSDDDLRDAIREGYARSATFRELIDHLADHRTRVLVEWRPSLSEGLAACLLHHLAVSPDGARRLWVVVRHHDPSDALVALIAHELQHVHEVLDAGVMTGKEMARVFERIGERSGSHGRARRFAVYDTSAARDVQRRVKHELHAAPPPTRGR